MDKLMYLADHFWFSLALFMFILAVIREIGRGLKWLIEYTFTPSKYEED